MPRQQGESALRKFTALPAQCLSVLGPRRILRVPTAAQNTDSSISICTSVGFRTLELSDYVMSASRLQPDISVVLADLPSSEQPSKRRIEKSADRTQAWLRYTLSQDGFSASPMLASLPPLEAEQQQLYLSELSNEYLESLSGLCIYEPATALILPPELSQLLVLCITDPPNPHALLHAISLGLDLITVPFVTSASEQGMAFTFTFPPPNTSSVGHAPSSPPLNKPLGIDLFSPTHATCRASLAPAFITTDHTSDKDSATIREPCQCYTCSTHHRAYVHHLLSAREMLAWTLLQIHNFHVLSTFFSSVRRSIRNGTFEVDRQAFEDYYSADFGIGRDTGTAATIAAHGNVDAGRQADGMGESEKIKNPKDRGPRLRGYQMKSLGRGEDRKREKVWGRFNHKDSPALKSTSGSQSPGTGAPAALPTNLENNRAVQVEEAKESKVASEDLELTASDFDTLGLAEKEEEVKMQ